MAQNIRSNKLSLKRYFPLAFGVASFRLLLISAGLSATLLTTTSLAMYSDSDVSPDSHFDTGTLSLGINPTTAIFNATGMKPGDVVYAPLTLTNTGTLGLQYSMTSSATNADSKGLAAALAAEVRIVASTTCNATTFTASSTTLAPAVTGLATLATSAPISLAASASSTACFKVSLPTAAGNSVQGAETNASFTFSSAQL